MLQQKDLNSVLRLAILTKYDRTPQTKILPIAYTLTMSLKMLMTTIHGSVRQCSLYRVSKKRPTLACYNFDTRERILIFLAEMLPIK